MSKLILIAIAKEVVLTYGPRYYREYKKPVIIRDISKEGSVDIPEGKIIYRVSFPYDKTEENLEEEIDLNKKL